MFVLFVSNYIQFENRQGISRKTLNFDSGVHLKGLGNQVSNRISRNARLYSTSIIDFKAFQGTATLFIELTS